MKPLVSLYLQSLKPYISRLSLPLLLRFLVLKHVQDFAGLASKAYLGDWNQSLSFNLLYTCSLIYHGHQTLQLLLVDDKYSIT
uniref:Uncharacterized protein n=1 Tax=Populus trichocarpa TaxID=3694 RepID=A0A3N7GLS1_POPTR